ncbi:MAG: arginine--tRNA ligase [Peptococcaceae bacterium]|nr:arginine--tRNA ligase [Peptococcaceae bacterium]
MNIIEDTKSALRQAVAAACQKAMADGVLPEAELPDFVIETPKDEKNGDFSTNVAMQLTRIMRQNPRKIAEAIVGGIALPELIDHIDIAGPGFINFYLVNHWLHKVLPAIQQEDADYGKSNAGNGERIQVEFVSANPTGLLHMGNARGGALGDTLAAVLNEAGYACDKEYYINDAGNQVENLGKSVEARYFELLGRDDYEIPEDGYHGKDIIATAQRLLDEKGEAFVDMPEAERRQAMKEYALKEKVTGIRGSLENFGVVFDNWFSEQSLHDAGDVHEVVEILRGKGYVYEKDGAQWLQCTAWGEEKDEVLVRSNGTPTYFAADIAYHRNKFERGYKRLINIWGADHHGHVARLKGAMTALGYPGEDITVILMQLVRLYRGGEIVKMSKRSGQYVTLDELIEEVGKEAARFFFIMRNPDSALDFDLDLAKAESSDNPVYYVQYAHARICSILSVAGVDTPLAKDVDLSLLSEEAERVLIRKLAEWPQEVADAARELAPYHLAYYAKDLATAFHSFYNSCKVLTDDAALRDARLALVDCSRITLRNVLQLLGLTAPERM